MIIIRSAGKKAKEGQIGIRARASNVIDELMSCILRCSEELARITAITQRDVIMRFVGAVMLNYLVPRRRRGGMPSCVSYEEAFFGGAGWACEKVQRYVALRTFGWTQEGCDTEVPCLTWRGVEFAFLSVGERACCYEC